MHTADLRRIISLKDHRYICKADSLRMIRERIKEFRDFKYDQLDEISVEYSFLIPSRHMISSLSGFKKDNTLKDYKTRSQKEYLKSSIDRLDRYLRILSDDTLNEFENEENDIDIKRKKGLDHLLKAEALFERNRHYDGLMELKKSCLYDGARSNIMRSSYYLNSEYEEHRFLRMIMKGNKEYL